jgi:hypothetical protein
MTSTVEKGTNFEESVAEMLRLLGYDVKRDEGIAGSQLDLIACRATGAINESYVVECKDWKDRVSIETIRQFDSTVRAARTRQPSLQGIIVARTGFTREAKMEAEALAIQAISFDELDRKLIDLGPYAKLLVNQFESDELSTEYIPLDAYEISGEGAKMASTAVAHRRRYVPAGRFGLPSSPARDYIIRRALYDRALAMAVSNPRAAAGQLHAADIILKERPELIHWLDDDIDSHLFAVDYEATLQRQRLSAAAIVEDSLRSSDTSGVILVGDYGTGKTSFLRHFAAELAKRFLLDPSDSFCPIILPLSKFPDGISEASLVSEIAGKIGCRHLSWPLLSHYFANRRMLLFLDGFDEMGFQVTAQHRRVHFVSIFRLLQQRAAKAVITGRPGYFPLDEEMRELCNLMGMPLPRVKVLHLASFSGAQVDAFLAAIEKKHADLQAAQIRQQIHTVYNLRELAARPFLLHLIVKTLPELRRESGPVTPARLYQIYTTKWLDREYEKGEFRWLIKKEQKRAFMMVVAWEMLKQGGISVHFSALSDWVKDHFKLDTSESVDHFSHDIRTCSFLSRDDAGNYFFVHRSFMEYFVALRLVEESRSGHSIIDLLKTIPRNLVSLNSIAFCVDMISEEVEHSRTLLMSLPSLTGGVLPILRMLFSLPLGPRERVFAYVRSLPPYSQRFASAAFHMSNDGCLLGAAVAVPRSGDKGKRKSVRKKPQICAFCGARSSGENSLIYKGDLICEKCTESAQVALLQYSPQVSGKCSFCKRNPSEFFNTNKSARICRHCVASCAETAVKRRANVW